MFEIKSEDLEKFLDALVTESVSKEWAFKGLLDYILDVMKVPEETLDAYMVEYMSKLKRKEADQIAKRIFDDCLKVCKTNDTETTANA